MKPLTGKEREELVRGSKLQLWGGGRLEGGRTFPLADLGSLFSIPHDHQE